MFGPFSFINLKKWQVNFSRNSISGALLTFLQLNIAVLKLYLIAHHSLDCLVAFVMNKCSCMIVSVCRNLNIPKSFPHAFISHRSDIPFCDLYSLRHHRSSKQWHGRFLAATTYKALEEELTNTRRPRFSRTYTHTLPGWSAHDFTS